MGRNVDASHVCIIGGLTVHSGDDASRHAIGGGEGHGAVIRRGCVQGGCGFREVPAIRATSPAGCASTRSKGSSCGGGSLLNSASVMVLVTSQSGATRESLLTIGVRALVGSLARMDAAMASQGARVTERLCKESARVQTRIVGGPYLSATFAHVRLFAGVDALVHGEGGALDELLTAVGVIAHVRTNAAVNTF